ncbi:hypothetical protein [Chromobacterium amazonense]|uniref:hypothetical protein n=1 Tax=Chromobacterium amazonense TaxID=1382803 RepID=UPI0031F67F50
MLKFCLQLLLTLISAYWAGKTFRENERIDRFVTNLEIGYTAINKKIKTANEHDALMKVKKFYGWSCIIGLILFFASSWLLGNHNMLMPTISMIVLFSFAGWFSIKWCTNHKKTIREILPTALKIVLSPIGAALLDKFFGTKLISSLTLPFQDIPQPIYSFIPHINLNGLAEISISMSIFLLAGMLLYYVLTWIMLAPIAFASIALTLAPIKLARFIDKITPNNAFAGLTFIIALIASIALIYL